MNQSPMNKIRRIAVLRSLLLDFFFDLRLAIVFPPAIQAKKSGLDPLRKTRLAKAQTAQQIGPRKTVRTVAQLFFEIGDFSPLYTKYVHPAKPGYVKIKSL